MGIKRMLVFSILTGLAVSAHAQFRGDMFFDVPSVSGAPGEIVTLTVSAFGGSDPVGAAQGQVLFDSTLLELVGIFPRPPFDTPGALQTQLDDGKMELLVANFVSLSDPIGIARFADIEFRVLGDPRQIVLVEIVNQTVLLTDRTDITNGSLGGEITITNQASSVASGLNHSIEANKQTVNNNEAQDIIVLVPGTAEYNRAIRLRPAGSTLQMSDEAGNLQRVMIPLVSEKDS